MKKGIVLLFIITIIILSMPQYAYSAPNSHKKVIVLIVDNINYNDLINYGGENINYLLKNGALGLMNTNSGGSYTDSNGYATIGAGAYAVSTSIGGYAGGRESLFNQEPINEVYERNTGRKQKEGNIANIDILGLTKQNEKLNRPVKIGLLGTLLNEHGYKTALIGNESTTFDDVNVKASLISMNGEGITNLGIVDKSLIIKDFMSPFGIKTDYKALYDAYKKVKDRADFIVIQTGDTHRLNKYMNISDERHKKNKTNIFAEIDELLGKIMKNNDKDTLLMLVVPFPSNDDILNGNRLTPVITFSKSLQKGILTSATTKRDGVITNTDLATHVLAYFQIPKDSLMTGHEVTSKDVGEPLKYLLKLNEISVFNYKIRSAVVKTYISYIIAVFLATFVFMVYFKKHLSHIKLLLIAIMLTPTVLLILPLFNPWNVMRLVISMVVTIAVLSFTVFYLCKDSLQMLIAMCFFSIGVIVLDTFLKNPLMKVSILGYDPIVGARFYGIGNEYMGFLLGATVIGTAALADRYRCKGNVIIILNEVIYVAVLIILMAPTLGTNVGGAMAAFASFGVATMLNIKGKVTKKDFICLTFLLILLLLLLFIYDGMRPPEVQSHIGQTSYLVKQNSLLALFQIFSRKLSMNYKLMRYSTWTWVLFATITTLGILFRWPVGMLKAIFGRHIFLYHGFISGIIGTIVALALNDSGVVAAAMFMIPVTISLIIMCIDEEVKTHI